MSPRGFSIMELVVALTLSALAASAGYRVLHSTRRVYQTQAARVALDQEVRAAASILAAELRQLDAGDPTGSDIVAMTPASLTYRATRSVRFLCEPPDLARARVVLADAPRFGDREPGTAQQSLLLHSAGGPAAPAGRWLRVTPTRRSDGATCPGGRPGMTLTLAEPVDLSSVDNGAPLRTVELVRIQAYRDADGVYWIGARSWLGDGSWSDLQPFAGPVGAGGLEFEFFDRQERVTALPANVALIGVSITARALEPPHRTLRLSTRVALRNGPRW